MRYGFAPQMTGAIKVMGEFKLIQRTSGHNKRLKISPTSDDPGLITCVLGYWPVAAQNDRLPIDLQQPTTQTADTPRVSSHGIYN